MSIKPLLIIILSLTIYGCTTVHIQPVDLEANLRHVCIQENHRVKIYDFLTVLRDGFDRHGISTQVFSGSIPEQCEYILTYTALQSWDFNPYLSHAEIRLEKNGRKIAYAEYHLSGKGGFSLMKWQGTKAKMDPVIDELLKAY